MPVKLLVIACGAPFGDPDRWSIAIRHRFTVPPRSLEKYSHSPSGDHSGDQSVAASFVTATGVPPFASTVQRSRCPPVFAQYAIRRPSGDQTGWTASPSRSLALLPVETSTTHS